MITIVIVDRNYKRLRIIC